MIKSTPIGTLKITGEVVLEILAGTLRIYKTLIGKEVFVKDINFYTDTVEETIASDKDIAETKEILAIMEEKNEELYE